MIKIGDIVKVSKGSDYLKNNSFSSMALVLSVHQEHVLVDYINNCKSISDPADIGIVYIKDIQKVELDDPRK